MPRSRLSLDALPRDPSHRGAHARWFARAREQDLDLRQLSRGPASRSAHDLRDVLRPRCHPPPRGQGPRGHERSRPRVSRSTPRIRSTRRSISVNRLPAPGRWPINKIRSTRWSLAIVQVPAWARARLSGRASRAISRIRSMRRFVVVNPLPAPGRSPINKIRSTRRSVATIPRVRSTDPIAP